jgi:hypothetical protein
MAPGGCRSSWRALVVVLALVAAMLLGSAPASAGGGGGRYAGGDAGSGAPALPVVYPDAPSSPTRATAVTFNDLTSNQAWAASAIAYVAGTNDWMRDFRRSADGTYPFRPNALETRKYFARSLVRAFAPDQTPPALVFSDLDPSSAWYRFAAVAIGNGWMRRGPQGTFLPDAAVRMRDVHRALALALGLKPAADALDRLHTRNGVTFKLPRDFGTTILGMRLGLRYNAPTGSEQNDVGPTDQLSRAQVAFSLFRAKTQPSYSVPNLLTQYDDVQLPFLGPRQRAIVQWGVRYAGYPYIWGGEWGLRRPEPSALGGQPRSGFDCSGMTWWALRANDSYAWKVAPPRPYRGWNLPQRTSGDMARMTTTRLTFDDLRPGDIAFYDGDRNGTVDHVDTYIGNGYALDSSSTPGGVTIMWVGDGWYRDHFVYGRRIIR